MTIETIVLFAVVVPICLGLLALTTRGIIRATGVSQQLRADFEAIEESSPERD